MASKTVVLAHGGFVDGSGWQGVYKEAGDRVVVSVLYDGRGNGSGVRIEGRFWYLMKLRNGKLVRWEIYPERTQALEAAGVRE